MKTVLIVDDNADSLSLARHVLAREGFECSTAADGESAWKLLIGEAPDVLVMDVNMPGADGWSILSRLRADGRTYSIPVVMMSASVDLNLAERAHALAAEYLDKSALTSLLPRLVEDAVARAAKVTPPHSPAMLDKRRVRLVLASGPRVEGTVHISGELDRFSDSWDALMRDHRSFVPVTEATVYEGEAEGELVPFLLIHKSDVRVVIPRA